MKKNTALVLIDYQEGFNDPKWGKRNNPNAEENAAKLLEHFRKNRLTVIHIQHDSVEKKSPLRPAQPGHNIKDIVKPLTDENLFHKNVNSAFIGTGLESFLKENSLQTLVIAGLTTDHCVSTTARMAANLGFTVYVVSDATATFEREGLNGTYYSAEEVHEHALASLKGEFAYITNTDTVLSEE